MLIQALGDDGALTGEGTLTCAQRLIGGILITADGTNNAVVIVRAGGASGPQVVDVTTKQPLWIRGPIGLRGSQTLHYNVSGTGAAAQFFEWVE